MRALVFAVAVVGCSSSRDQPATRSGSAGSAAAAPSSAAVPANVATALVAARAFAHQAGARCAELQALYAARAYCLQPDSNPNSGAWDSTLTIDLGTTPLDARADVPFYSAECLFKEPRDRIACAFMPRVPPSEWKRWHPDATYHFADGYAPSEQMEPHETVLVAASANAFPYKLELVQRAGDALIQVEAIVR